jgi:hypothetical protein
MKSTNCWPRLSEPAGPDDPFEELRASYYARLRSDRVRLLGLRAELSGTGAEPKYLYEAIRVVAHGMAGAAGIFEATDVLNAASAIENAARVSLQSRANRVDPAVRAGLDALIDLLQPMTG